MKAAVKLVDDEAGAFDRGPQQHWRAKPVAERGAIPSRTGCDFHDPLVKRP